jgi:hypothetical protein
MFQRMGWLLPAALTATLYFTNNASADESPSRPPLVGGWGVAQQQLSFGFIQGELQNQRDQIRGPGWHFPPLAVTLTPYDNSASVLSNPVINRPLQVPGSWLGGQVAPLRLGELSSDPGRPLTRRPPPGPGLDRLDLIPSEQRFSGAPAGNETRFVPNEVLIQASNRVLQAQVEQIAQQQGLTLVTSENFEVFGRTFYRFRSDGGRDICAIIRALEGNPVIVSVQPNYQFTLSRDAVSASQSGARVAQNSPVGRTHPIRAVRRAIDIAHAKP